MSCAACEETLRSDGYQPPCAGPVPDDPQPGVNECWITPLPHEALRAAGIRQGMLRLAPVIGAEAAMRHLGATEEDIDNIGLIEAALETVGKEAVPDGGERLKKY